MKSLLLASTVLVALSSSVFAADVIDTVPDVAPIASSDYGYDWSGLYLGLQAGIVGAQVDLETPFASIDDVEDFGAAGGAHVGYNVQFGNGFVLGAEADFQATGVGEEGVDLDYLGTVTGKVGYAVDRLLAYGKGGFAYGHFDGVDGAVGLDDEWQYGYTLGAGVAVGITDSISIRTEYNYVNFDNADIEAFGRDIGDASADVHQVTAGISYKF